MSSFHSLLLASALALATGTGALAQNVAPSNPAGSSFGPLITQMPGQPRTPTTAPVAQGQEAVLTEFTTADIQAILREIGATDIQVGQTNNGNPMVSAKRDGILFHSALAACQNNKCVGLEIFASWDTGGTKISGDAVNKYNSFYSFAKAYVSADGSVYLSRYLTADYGIARSNVAVNYESFLGSVPNMLEKVGL